MKGSKQYLKDLDFIRFLSCVMILFYHMNILKGGYLFVCTFFVLSGYLSATSLLKKKKISLKEYYFNKFKKIYLPFLMVTLITVAIVSFFPSINWFNLKPETTSVLLGYNNFWQLSANMDYFARHISSPFMHFWYMGIILQFDLIFPIIFMLIQKTKDKISKYAPCAITFFLAISFTMYFFVSSLNDNLMANYYNTFTRAFSLLCGVYLAFVHHYFKKRKSGLSENPKNNKILYYLLLLISVVTSFYVSSDCIYYGILMILITFISLGFVEYAFSNKKRKNTKSDKAITFFSGISYEIYLVQYPIIFGFQYINLNIYLECLIIVVSTFLLAYILKFSLDFKGESLRFVRKAMLVILTLISIYGAYQYLISEDHSAEMQELALKLEQNAALMDKKKEEYAQMLKQEKEEWEAKLKDLDNIEAGLPQMISNAPIVGIGDSVMLGAVDTLKEKFSKGYFDAAVSRTAWVAGPIISSLSKQGLLGDPVVIGLGTNGDCNDACKDNIIKSLGNRKIFWLNVTNDRDVNFNATLEKFANKYKNLHIVDWNEVSKGHREYFVADRIHLTEEGKKAYTDAIYNKIYEVYLNEYQEMRDELNSTYEQNQKNKFTFIGNELLINSYEYFSNDFPSAILITNEKYTFDTLINDIRTKLVNNLSDNIVIMLDNSFSFTKENYEEIISLCNSRKIYIVLTHSIDLNIELDNIKIIPFYEEIKNNSDYLMVDKVHLTMKGNEALALKIKNAIVS